MSPAAYEVPRTAGAPRVVCASAIAARVATFLEASPAGIGRVHSVFDRAVNVVCGDGRLLVLHGPGPLAAPFGIAVAERVAWRQIERGTPVTRNARGHVGIAGLCIATTGARIADSTIGPGAWREAAAAIARLDVRREPVEPRASAALVQARDATRRIAAGIRRGDARELLEGARPLIGLGEGLTPAGDDLLVGVLAVLHRARSTLLSGAPDVASALADAARHGTTSIAREFVLHALDGHFAEPIVALLTAGDGARARDALRYVLAMGATSGADTVAGIRLALEAVASASRPA